MFGTANLRLLSSALLVGLSLVTPQADASAATLTFNQLPNSVDIENYFNGGLSSYAPAGTGPAYGVAFSNNAEELKQGFNGNAPSGGTGKFENNPSGANGILYFAFSNSTTSYLNAPGGFTGLTLGYSLLNNSSAYDYTIELFSGLNRTGTMLASLLLTPASTSVACAASPSTSTNGPSAKDEFCAWSSASVGEFGVAESIYFGAVDSSSLQEIEFDNVQLTPVPAALPLFGAGLGVLGLFKWRARRNAASIAA
jgi:hypothetical protein